MKKIVFAAAILGVASFSVDSNSLTPPAMASTNFNVTLASGGAVATVPTTLDQSALMTTSPGGQTGTAVGASTTVVARVMLPTSTQYSVQFASDAASTLTSATLFLQGKLGSLMANPADPMRPVFHRTPSASATDWKTWSSVSGAKTMTLKYFGRTITASSCTPTRYAVVLRADATTDESIELTCASSTATMTTTGAAGLAVAFAPIATGTSGASSATWTLGGLTYATPTGGCLNSFVLQDGYESVTGTFARVQ
jgi:hypothetical protein